MHDAREIEQLHQIISFRLSCMTCFDSENQVKHVLHKSNHLCLSCLLSYVWHCRQGSQGVFSVQHMNSYCFDCKLSILILQPCNCTEHHKSFPSLPYIHCMQTLPGALLVTWNFVLKCHHCTVTCSLGRNSKAKAGMFMSRFCSPSRPAGPPLRPSRGTTAVTLALFWTSRLSRWRRWIQRCLLFHLAIASGTCCWGTRHFRMMTGSMKNTVRACVCILLSSSLSGYLNCYTAFNSCCTHFPSSCLIYFYFNYCFPTFPIMTSHDNPLEMWQDLYSAVGFLCRWIQ